MVGLSLPHLEPRSLGGGGNGEIGLASSDGFGSQPVERDVVMGRVVMKRDQVLRSRQGGELERVRNGTVSPADSRGVFCVRLKQREKAEPLDALSVHDKNRHGQTIGQMPHKDQFEFFVGRGLCRSCVVRLVRARVGERFGWFRAGMADGCQ